MRPEALLVIFLSTHEGAHRTGRDVGRPQTRSTIIADLSRAQPLGNIVLHKRSPVLKLSYRLDCLLSQMRW